MDKLVFQQEGWPLTQEALTFIESAYLKPLEGLGKAFGRKVGYYIISGVKSYFDEQLGQQAISSGLMLWDGELIPFVGGVEQQNVVLVNELVTGDYDDTGSGTFDNTATVWRKRYAKFGQPQTGEDSAAFGLFQAIGYLAEKPELIAQGTVQLTPGVDGNGEVVGVSATGTGSWYSVSAVLQGDKFRVTLTFPEAVNYQPVFNFKEIFGENYGNINVVSNDTDTLSFSYYDIEKAAILDISLIGEKL